MPKRNADCPTIPTLLAGTGQLGLTAWPPAGSARPANSAAAARTHGHKLMNGRSRHLIPDTRPHRAGLDKSEKLRNLSSPAAQASVTFSFVVPLTRV